MTLPNISPDLLKTYQEEIARLHSPKTVKRKMSSLRRFFNWAQGKGIITENPLDRSSVVSGQLPVISYQSSDNLKTRPPSQGEGVAGGPIPDTSTLIKPFPSSGSPAEALAKAGFPFLKSAIFAFSGVIAVTATFLFLQNRLPSLFSPQLATQQAQTKEEGAGKEAEVLARLEEIEKLLKAKAEVQALDVLKAKVLELLGENPVIQALEGALKIESQGITLKTFPLSDGDITLAPDGQGQVLIRSSVTDGNAIDIRDANLTNGTLLYGNVGHTGSKYKFLEFTSGEKETTRFSVDAQGNIFSSGKITANEAKLNELRVTKEIDLAGDLLIGGVVRLNSAGRLGSITGYYQDSGIFKIDQGAPDYAQITKSLTNSTGPATAPVLKLALDETNVTFPSNQDTLTLERKGGKPEAYALNIKSGNALFSGDIVVQGNIRGSGALNVTGNQTVSGNQTVTGDLAVNGGDLTSSATTFNLLNSTVTTLNIGGAATTLSVGAATGTTTVNNDLTVSGVFRANGAVYLGDGDDAVLINGTTFSASETSTTTFNISDNITDAFDIQQGTNNYINVNTTNSSENIAFGNATTNPTFSFLGTGGATIAGSAEGTSALTLTKGDLVISDGDLTLSGGEISATSDDATGTAFSFTGVSTTGNVLGVTANSLTTGNALSISSTSTAGGASGNSYLLNLSRSGANTNTAHTAYGLYSSVTNTNATSGTNIAGYFTASGATTANYGLIVANGSVGIGDTSPAAALTVGDGDLFQVSGTTGSVTINNASDTGSLTVEGTVLDINSLDFVGAGTLTSGAGTNLTFTPGTTGDLVFSTDADTVATFAGSAEGTANVTLTAGDLTISDGDLTLSSGETAFTSDDTTGNANTFANSSFAVAATATGNLLNLTFTNASINTTGTAVTTGLNIAGTNSSAGTGGIMETYGIRVRDIAGTTGLGTQTSYGIRVGNQGQTSGENAYGIYIDPQTSSTTAVALCFDCDGTWTSSTVAAGIQFGTDVNAVNLYRSASDTLRTDDSLYVAANTTLGDAASDTVTFNAVVASNILADASNTRDLGSSSVRWANGYFTTIDATNLSGTVTGGSTTAATWTINSDNSTNNAEVSGLAFETGSATFNAVVQWNASGDAGRYTGYDNNFVYNYPISIFSQVSGGSQTFTSGSLFNYGQDSTHAITQGGAFVGVDIDFSSNITNSSQNQTGVLITLKDGSVSGTAIGFQTAGTLDYGLDIGGTVATADIRLSNGETIDNLTNNQINLNLGASGTLLLTSTTASTIANSAGILTLDPTTGLAVALTDNQADALDIQQGTDNYININTTNASENISFGNATTNPSYSFLGTGAVTIAGSADGTDALILTNGDILISNGDFDLSGGDFNVTLDDQDVINLAGTAASSTSGNGAAAANLITATGPAGQATSGTTGQTGGVGSAFSFTGGTGGAATGATGSNTGGAGGALTLLGGTGGAATSGTGGAGGAMSITAGNAGSGGNANGGTLTLNSGAVTGTGTSTLNLGSANVTTLNIATAATTKTVNLADVASTNTIEIGGVTNDGTDTVSIATNGTANADTIVIGNTNASTTLALTGGDDWSMAATGVLTMSASASQTTAIVITDTDYTNALSIEDNVILGTTAAINFTDFDVSSDGLVVLAPDSGLDADLNYMDVQTPAITATAATTIDVYGISSAGALTTTADVNAETLTYRAINLTLPNMNTAESGDSTLVTGLLLTPGTITNGAGTETVTGIDIANITGGSGTDLALTFGTGWDTDINATTSLEVGIGGTNELYLDGDDFSPYSDGGSALGTTSLGWNGLHLNTTTAINWENGDVTLTHATNTLTLAGASSGYVFNDGIVYINDTANTGMTTGLTINQGTATNEILAFKGSDVAHGMTTLYETDTFAGFAKLGGADGGLAITGIRDTATTGQAALQIRSFGPTDNTTKTSAGRAYIEFASSKISGNTYADPGTDANLFGISYNAGNNTQVFLFDKEGDFWLGGDIESLGGTEIAINETGADVNFRVEADSNANLLVLDAGLFSGVGQLSIGSAAQGTVTAFTVIDNPAITATANQNFYKLLIDNSAAVTVSGATTSPIVASLAVDEPNITATGTVTDATTLYIQAAPTEGTSNYALWIDDGFSLATAGPTYSGARIDIPALTATGTSTTANLRGFQLGTAGALNTTDDTPDAAQTINWYGTGIQMPNLTTAEAGDTTSVYGLYIAAGTLTDGAGTENEYGIYITGENNNYFSGNVGIGTTSPGEKLTLSGNSAYISFDDSDAVTDSKVGVDTSGNGLIQMYNSAGTETIRLYANSGQNSWITSGNVGIGTTAPAGMVEIDTGTATGVALTIDQDDVDQTALDLDINNTAGDIINLDWGGATTQTGAITGLDLDFANLTTDGTNALYGLRVTSPVSNTASTQYGIYQSGTTWDYGLYVEDDAYLALDLTVAGGDINGPSGENIDLGEATADTITFYIATAAELSLNATALFPSTDSGQDLGSSTSQFADLYLDGGNINLDNATDIDIDDAVASVFTISQGSNNFLAISTDTDAVSFGNATTNPTYRFLGTGSVTIDGSADGTDALILTNGDILISNGDFDLSGGDFNVTLDDQDVINLAGTAASSTSGNGAAAANLITATGPVGQATSGTTGQTGGAGSAFSFTGGTGGAATGATGSNTGGAGGALTLLGGTGGAATSGTGGAGGAMSITAGSAGSGGNANGGTLTLNSGAVTGTGTSTINLGTSNSTVINIGDSTVTKTIDIGGVTSSDASTISIATEGTAADTIAIGNTSASTTLSLTGGDDWSISTAGAATFASGTFNGNVDMTNDLILNIGAAGTDFTTGGGLTLAELLTVNDDVDFVFDAAENLNIDATTTANTTTAGVIDLNVTSLTHNNRGLDISYTSTAAGATATVTQYGIASALASTQAVIATSPTFTYYGNYQTATKSGADNLTTGGTFNTYGIYSDAQNTSTDVGAAGTRNTYAGYFTATGAAGGTTTAYGIYTTAASADTNYAIYSNAGINYFGGNVGIGTTAPQTDSLSSETILHIAGAEPALLFEDTTASSDDYLVYANSSNFNIWNDTDDRTDFTIQGDGDVILAPSAGNVGIGTTAPDAALEINHATGDSLRLTYNDSNGSATNYTDFSLSSTGALTITGSAATLTASATAEKTFLTLTPGTTTLTAPTQVTSLMETAVLTGATIAADAATTVDKATTLSLTAPVDSTNATITDDSALRILNVTSGAGTLTSQYGLYIENLTAGTNDYGIYIAGADTYALWVDAGNARFDGHLSVGSAGSVRTTEILMLQETGSGDGSTFDAITATPTANATISTLRGAYFQTLTSASAITVTNNYGIQIDNASKGAGSTITTNYGLYINDQTAGSTNFALYSAGGTNYFGGNVGIGDSTPSSLLEVGNGTDSIQFSTVGDITFVDADGGASITGPAGGALSVLAGVSQALTITGAAASTWSTSNGLLTITGDDGLTLNASTTAGITGNVPDNIANAIDIQQGTDNYININTTNTSENISFGNATTNPSYSFLGTSAVTIAGSADGTDALILTNGDILVSNGDFDLSGGDFNVTLDDQDVINLAGTAASSTSGNGAAAANLITATGPAGQATSGTTGQTGGAGSAFSLTGGAGGAATGATGSNTGGAGGAFTFLGGTGGAATSGTGGAGGTISITAGSAGTGGNANGGTLTLNSGAVTGSGTSTINLGTSNSTVINLGDSTVTKTIDIGGVTSSDASTISIATEGTAADTIAIGNTNAATTLALTGGDDWSMAATGVLTMSASASQTTAIIITDTDYTNSLNIGDNTITGTTANIDLTYFDVTGSTGAVTIDPQTTGTYLDFTLETAWTSGTLINADFASATTQGAAAITGVSLNLNTNLTTPAAGQNVTGIDVQTPVASTTSNATTYTGYNLSAAGAITNGTAGSFAWRGVNITMPNITQSAGGSVTASGILVTNGTITTAGTQNTVNLSMTAVGAGTLNGLLISPPATTTAGGTINGINIGNITTSNGTDTAVSIGSGWDTDIAFVDSSVIIDGPASSSITFQDFTTITASSVTALNCSDCIDFDDMADALALDASTSITQDGAETFTITNSGSGNTIINLASTGDFDIQDNGTSAFFVTDTGNVGIGTTAPGNKLHIADTNSAIAVITRFESDSTNIAYFGAIGSTNTSFGTLRQQRNMWWADGTGSLGIDIVANKTDADFRIYTGGNAAGNERFRITSGGNVGIGDTTPDALFDIDSAATTTNVSAILATAITSGNVFDLSSTSTAATSSDLIQGDHTATYTTAQTVSGQVIDLSRALTINAAATTLTVSGAVATISDNCTVTLGTCTSSADVLTVTQSYASNSGSALNVTTAGTGFALRVNDDGTLTDSTPFVVDASGNVGIGTTSPEEKLHVQGSTLLAQGATSPAGMAAGTIFEVRGDAGGTAFVDADFFKGFKIALDDNTEWGGQAQFSVGRWEENAANARSSLVISLGHGGINSATDADVDVMTLLSSGNVGIGDTTPDALLDLDSSATTGQNFLITNTGVYTGTGVAQITANSATTGDILAISGTALTTGSLLTLTGPSAGTAGVTDAVLKISSDVGNIGTANGLISSTATIDLTAASASGVNLFLSTTNSNGTNANTVYGAYNTLSDSVALGNTDYGEYITLNVTGDVNATKTAYGIYSTVTNDNTTTDQGIRNAYAGYFSVTGSTRGTNTTYGIYTTAASGDTNYALYSNAGVNYFGGNVGIGTTAPAGMVEIDTGTASGVALTIDQDDTDATALDIDVTNVSGTLINLAYSGATTHSGADTTGLSLNLNTNVTGAADLDVTGVNVQTPALTSSGTATTTYTVYNISAAGALVQNTAAGTINWRGLNITMPSVTQTTGTITTYGALITPPATTGGTTYGIDIGNVTTSTGTDTAIRVGSGWDTDLAFVDSSVILDGPASSSITFQDFTTITASSVTALNCSDCIDFDDLVNSMTLDEATTITNGLTGNLTISLTSTGDFVVEDAASDTTPFIIDQDGNVGIGTTGPSRKVHIDQTNASQGLRVSSTVSTGQGGIELMSEAGASDNFAYFSSYGSDYAGGGFFGVGAGSFKNYTSLISSQAANGFQIGTNDAAPLMFGTNNAEVVRITSGGNVGIGDTTPDALLDLDSAATTTNISGILATAITTGNVFDLSSTSTAATSSDLIQGDHTATYTATSTVSGNISDLSRALTINDADPVTLVSTLTVNSPVVTISDNCTVAGNDVCTHSGNVLSLTQSYGTTTGSILSLTPPSTTNAGGTLEAINIGSITTSNGTDLALTFGTGWDTDINATTSLEVGIGGTNEVVLNATDLSPATSDGSALGTGSLMWSDLFLASGGVINLNNGDVTLTHSANTLAFAGAATAYTFDGLTIIGHTSSLGRLGQQLEVTTSANYGGIALNTFSATAGHESLIDFNRSKSSTKGTQSLVASADALGGIVWRGSDGVAFIDAAYIDAAVDGTTGVNDMPGVIRFGTTADNAASASERMRITSGGNVGIGTTAPSSILEIEKDQNTSTFVQVDNNTAGTGAAAYYVALSDAAEIFLISFSSSYTTSNQYIADSGVLETRSSSGGLVLSTNTDTPISFWQNNAEKMRIAAGGNVGIGTTAPAGMVEIDTGTASGVALTIDQDDTDATALDIDVTNVSGTLINLAYSGATTHSGADTTGLSLNLNTNVTGAADLDVTGVNVQTPALTSSGTATTTYTVYNNSASGALLQNTAAGTINWRGLNITMPSVTQTTGTITTYGALITPPATTGGTTYGIDIGNVTTSTGTDTAIRVGSGWDTDLAFVDTSPIVTIGNGGTISFTDGTNTLFSIADDTSEGDVTVTGDLAVNGATSADITSTTTTATILNTTVTTLSIGGAATTALNIGNGNTAYTAINIGSGTGGNTINIAGTGATGADAINIGTGGTNADTITIGNNASTTSIALTSGTGSQTFTSNVATGSTTTSGFVFDATAITSGTGLYLTTDSVTTGRLLDIATTGNTWTGNGTTNGLVNIVSTSTAGTASSSDILLNIARSGANANTAHTAYGLYSSVTNTNATSGTNVAAYLTASGATTANYAIYSNAGVNYFGGNVGIGTTSPEEKLHVQGSTLLAQGATSPAGMAAGTILEVRGDAGGTAFVDADFFKGFKIALDDNTEWGGQAQFSVGRWEENAANARSSLVISLGHGAINSATDADVDVMTLLSSGNVGIGDTTPDALLDLDSSATTTDIFGILASSLTTGSAIVATGPTSTGVTDHFVKLTSDVGSAAALIYGAPDFSGSAVTGYGANITATDATANANTDYAYYGSLALTGNAAKTGYGLYSTITSTSTTADTTYGGYFNTAVSGAVASGIQNTYGVYGRATSSNVAGGTVNVYGGYYKADGTVASGTINSYGLYVANGTMNTTGTSANYGLYVETPSGADTNVAGYFGGNVGIGTTSPSTKLHTLINDSGVAVTDLLTLTHTTTGTIVGSQFTVDNSGTLGDDLIGYWKLDESSTEAAPVTRVDAAGASDLTDNNNVPSTTGKQGNAAQFDSAESPNEYLSITDNTAVSTGDISFTIAAWVYLDTEPAFAPIVAKDDNSGGNASIEYGLYYGSGVDTFRFVVGDGTETFYPVSWSSSVTTGTWYFVVAYRSAVDDTIKIEVNNGTAVSAAGPGAAVDGANPFTIGRGISGFMNGRIDEVGFWKRLLSSQEKTDLYNSGNGNTCTDDCNATLSTPGAGLLFQAEDSGGNTENAARISALLTNPTNTNEGSAITFENRTEGGSLTERMRIDRTGKVGIGDTTSIASTNLPNGSVVIGSGAFCVDDGGNNCDDALRTAGNIYAESTSITAIDLAENYPSKDSTLEAGEVVSVDRNNPEYVVRSASAYEPGQIGIVSTKPGILLGGFGSESKRFENDSKYPVALAGRIPVKVSTENGPILAGDPLTSSSTPGVAMRATRAGQIVGKALEQFDCSTTDYSLQTTAESGQQAVDGSQSTVDGFCQGKILAFVNVSWYDPDVYLTSTGDLSIVKSTTSSTLRPGSGQAGTTGSDGLLSPDATGSSTLADGLQSTVYRLIRTAVDGSLSTVDRIGAFSEAVVGQLKAGLIETQELISPVVQTDEIRGATDSGNLIVNLRKSTDYSLPTTATESGFGKLIVKGNLEVTEDATILGTLTATRATFGDLLADTASIKEELITNNLEVQNDATISATLYADRIIAREVYTEGISARSATFGELSASVAATQKFAFESAQQTNQSVIDKIRERIDDLAAKLPSYLATQPLSNSITQLLADTATPSAMLAFSAQTWDTSAPTASDSAVLADSSVLADFSLRGSLGITDNLSILGNINAFGTTTLKEAVVMGTINVMNGALIVDAAGDVQVANNLTVGGTLRAAGFGEILVKGADESVVASIDASGSAQFKEVTTPKLVIASSNEASPSANIIPGEVASNSTAGKAILPAGFTELKIYNPNVTENTLIYVTPITSTSNQVLYVKSKAASLVDSAGSPQAGYFTVAVDNWVFTDIEFNWWIIELAL